MRWNGSCEHLSKPGASWYKHPWFRLCASPEASVLWFAFRIFNFTPATTTGFVKGLSGRGCDLLSEFLTLHQQQQPRRKYKDSLDSCDLLSEFLTLHQQQQQYPLMTEVNDGCDLLSEFLTLHQQQQLKKMHDFEMLCCDLLSEFLTLHQQQQPEVISEVSKPCCDLLSEFLTLHQQQQRVKQITYSVSVLWFAFRIFNFTPATTTFNRSTSQNIRLWFAFRIFNFTPATTTIKELSCYDN